jgi:hypothetical protein
MFTEDVSFLIIEETRMLDASGVSYTTDIMIPTSLIMYGKYNDYGSVDGITETNAVKAFRSKFIEWAKSGRIYIEPDSYYDAMYAGPEDMSIVQIIEAIERDRVSVIRDDNRKVKWGLFMWKSHMYQDIAMYTNFNVQSLRTTVSRFVTEMTNEFDADFCGDLDALASLIFTMDMHRKIFIPQGGKGSQHADCLQLESYVKALENEIKRSRHQMCWEEQEEG